MGGWKEGGALDVSEETLEDLLTYDDHFLDYFNTFLGLTAFPLPLEYNRLAGTFEESEVYSNAVRAASGETLARPAYGPMEQERENMLEWAKYERLPLFMRTELFRELKLIKLLLRQLDDRNSASHRGSVLKGYSRHDSYVSSFSNSADNSEANDADDYDDWSDSDERYPIRRPYSLPAILPSDLSDLSFEHMYSPEKPKRKPKVEFKAAGVDNSKHGPLDIPPLALDRDDTKDSLLRERKETHKSQRSEKGKISKQMRSGRATSAPLSHKDLNGGGEYTQFEGVFLPDAAAGEAEMSAEAYGSYVQRVEESEEEERTETDVRELEEKLNMSLHQLKESALKTTSHFKEFQKFLEGTAGFNLVNFWLDCEYFKDTMQEYDDVKNMATRNQLFRDIQDKHKLSLTAVARAQISHATSNYGLNHSIFIRTQYDALRQLRAYWLPRFIVHRDQKEASIPVLISARASGRQPEDERKVFTVVANDPQRPSSSFFLPAVSVVQSLPLSHEDILFLTNSRDWGQVTEYVRTAGDRRRLASAVSRPDTNANALLREKMMIALKADRDAGGPFRTYLESESRMLELSNLLFWQDMADYGRAEERSADRLLRMNQAWTIYNLYVAPGSQLDIGISLTSRTLLYQRLQQSRDSVDSSHFKMAGEQAVRLLKTQWLRYLKDDVKRFIDCRVYRDEDEDMRPDSAADIEVLLLEGVPRILIKLPPPHELSPSTASSRNRSESSTPDSILVATRAAQRRKAMDMEKERERQQKALLKLVRERSREAKKRPLVEPFPLAPEDLNARKSRQNAEGNVDEEADGFSHSAKSRSGIFSQGTGIMADSPMGTKSRKSMGAASEREKELTFTDFISSKPMMLLFKRSLNSDGGADGRDLVSLINFYHEADAYFGLEQKPKAKKDAQATLLYKMYFDPKSKRKIPLGDRLANRLKLEKGRPKSGNIQDAQRFALGRIDPAFKDFFQNQATEFGLEPAALASMSSAELSLRAETDASLSKAYKKGAGANQPKKKNGKALPNKEDKASLLAALEKAGHSPGQELAYFYKYLVKHGDEDGVPLMDKNLLFYAEVVKYKELTHAYCDEDLLKKKAMAICECFLDSAVQPSCQISLASDMCTRIVKNVHRYVHPDRKETAAAGGDKAENGSGVHKGGKDIAPNLFDEPVVLVYKELLPYWAGFRKQYKQPSDSAVIPLSKRQKALHKRLDDFLKSKDPVVQQLRLPNINPSIKVAAFTFTLTDGLKVKHGGAIDDDDDDGSLDAEALANAGKMPPLKKGNKKSGSVQSSMANIHEAVEAV